MNYAKFQGDIAKIDYRFFANKKLTESDRIQIETYLSGGDYISAINFFSSNYLNIYSSELQNFIRYQLLVMSSRRFVNRDINTAEKEITSGIKIFTSSLMSIVLIFLAMYINQKTKELDLPEELIKLLENKYNKRFEELYNSRLGNTRKDISDLIRTIQKEIREDELLKGKREEEGRDFFDDTEKAKKKAKKKLRRELTKEEYNDLLDGKIIATNEFITPSGKTTRRRLKLDDYLNMSMEKIILDADRDLEELNALHNGHEVVEYYLRDRRAVKQEREACKFILAQSRYSKPLLALTEEAADKYQIMTVDEARGFLDGAMGPYCRHSFKSVSDSYMNKLAKEVN